MIHGGVTGAASRDIPGFGDEVKAGEVICFRLISRREGLLRFHCSHDDYYVLFKLSHKAFEAHMTNIEP
jgi:hypothetical protein